MLGDLIGNYPFPFYCKACGLGLKGRVLCEQTLVDSDLCIAVEQAALASRYGERRIFERCGSDSLDGCREVCYGAQDDLGFGMDEKGCQVTEREAVSMLDGVDELLKSLLDGEMAFFVSSRIGYALGLSTVEDVRHAIIGVLMPDMGASGKSHCSGLRVEWLYSTLL